MTNARYRRVLYYFKHAKCCSANQIEDENKM